MRQICRLVVALVLSGGICPPEGLAGNGGDGRSPTHDLQSEAVQQLRENLDGRELIVRVYPNLQGDSEKFARVSLRLVGDVADLGNLKEAYPDISRSCVVMIWAPDQTDRAVATLLGRHVRVSQYLDFGREHLRLTSLLTRSEHLEPAWTILDAEGQPIPNASVEVRADAGHLVGKVLLGEVTTDERGQLQRWLSYGVYTFVLTVSHPNYGIASVFYTHPKEEPSGVHIVPLVSRRSEATGRGIQGIVNDPAGRPVVGAEVQCWSMHLPDGTERSPNRRIGSTVLTDEKGWFSYCPAIVTEEFEYQGPLPKGTRYDLHIEPPKWTNLRKTDRGECRQVLGGSQIEVTLTPMEAQKAFHTFAFEDHDGPVTDRERLKEIVVSLRRDEREWVRLTYEQFKDGFALPPGILEAVMSPDRSRFCFEPIKLTTDSPEHLVFRAGAPICYRGQVFDARTTEPIGGAFVMTSHRYSTQDPCSLTDEQWRQLYTEAVEQSANHSREHLMRASGRVARTDASGFYELPFYPGRTSAIGNFTVLAPGYHRDSAYAYYCRPNAHGIAEVRPVRLRPQGPATIPTFIFLDETGPVTDPNKLKTVSLEIRGPAQTSHSTSLTGFIQSGHFIPGRYCAEAFWDGKRYLFEPVDLEIMPDVVVFRPQEIQDGQTLYQGQVVNAATGRPVPNAVVLFSQSGVNSDASSLQPHEWTAIRSLDRHPDMNDPALAPLLDLVHRPAPGMTQTVLTDENGWFDLVLSEARLHGHTLFVIHAEDFVGARQLLRFGRADNSVRDGIPRFDSFTPDSSGIVTLPPITLYPAATVRVQPVMEDPGIDMKRQWIRLRWSLHDDNLPAWAEGLRWSGDPRQARTFHTHELRPNVEQTVYVPAGVDLRLCMFCMVPRDPHPPVDLGTVHLLTGEIHELGTIQVDRGVEIRVKVVDSKGDALLGVPVRCSEGVHAMLSIPQRTDDEGVAFIRFRPHTRGRILVIHRDRHTGEVTEESVPYEVAGREDAGREFVLVLSDEFLTQLRQGGRRP